MEKTSDSCRLSKSMEVIEILCTHLYCSAFSQLAQAAAKECGEMVPRQLQDSRRLRP